MKRYSGLILALGFGVWVGACAPAATTGGGDANPEWTGPTPEDDSYTTTANLFVIRASQESDAAKKRELYQQALEKVQEGLQAAPQNPKIWNIAGQVQAGLGNYEAADSMFDKALELYPYYEEIEGHRENAWIEAYNRGVTALQSGDEDTALEAMRNAAVIYDGRPSAHLQLGALYARRNERDQAIDAYKKALEIIRTSPLKEKLNEEQKAQWRQSEEIATFNMAQLLAAEGRDAEAEEAYRAYLETHPDNIQAKINLATVLARQGKGDEASTIYDELMGGTDLGPSDFFRIGIGFFQAEEYVRAAEAFRKTIEMNAASRDGYYNLAQALYVRSTNLDDQLEEAATAADSTQLTSTLKEVYAELIDVAGTVEEMDPFNRNVLALKAQGLRGMADVTEDKAESDEWRNKALAVLQKHQDLPFNVSQVQFQVRDGQVQINGMVQNLALEAGAPIRLRFSILGIDGSTLATKEVTVSAPAKEQQTPFRLTAQVSGNAGGWSYERVE